MYDVRHSMGISIYRWHTGGGGATIEAERVSYVYVDVLKMTK